MSEAIVWAAGPWPDLSKATRCPGAKTKNRAVVKASRAGGGRSAAEYYTLTRNEIHRGTTLSAIQICTFTKPVLPPIAVE